MKANANATTMPPAPTPSTETLASVPDHRKTRVGWMIDRGAANVVASPSRVKIGSRCSLSNDTASRTAETPRYAVRPVDEGREKRLLYLRASSSVEEEDNRDTGSAE